MSREAKMERNRIRLQERRKQNRARKAEGQKDPAPDAGGKSKGAQPKIMRYPLSMIDSSTDYLKIQIQEYKSKGSSTLRGVTSLTDTVEDLEYLEGGKIKRDIGGVAKSFSSNAVSYTHLTLPTTPYV